MSKRSDFPIELPLVHSEYCFKCGAQTVTKINKIEDGVTRVFFKCSTCDETSDRVRIWDPNMIQYFDDEQNLVHEGAGVIVQNEFGEVLLFLRTKYPFLWTIPGGHMSPNEDHESAALRELYEEVKIKPDTVSLIFEGIIFGDECMGGSDIHKWHLYYAKVKDVNVILDEEGSKFGWFSIKNIPDNLTFPVRYLLEQSSVQKALGIIP